MKHYLVQDLKEVDEKQVYEWVRVGVWNMHTFLKWLEANKIKHYNALYWRGILIHRDPGWLVYEWIKTKLWNLRMFRLWLSTFREDY
jgi:hypothetical protein